MTDIDGLQTTCGALVAPSPTPPHPRPLLPAVCLPDSLPSLLPLALYLFSSLPPSLPASLPSCLPAFLPSCLPAFLPLANISDHDLKRSPETTT